MSDDSRPSRARGHVEGKAPLLDSVARRVEQLTSAVVEQTERLLRKSKAPDRDLASILEAARRSAELAHELVELAHRERDQAAAEILNVTRGSAVAGERASEHPPASSHRRAVRAPAKSGPCVVLLVEDEALLLRTMGRMLEQYGHRVIPAADPVVALALAEKEPELDLLVTDLELPGMKGSELVKRLRSVRPELRVLYTSGWDRATSGVEMADDGTEAFLSKPFSAADLEARLAELLGTPAERLAERR